MIMPANQGRKRAKLQGEGCGRDCGIDRRQQRRQRLAARSTKKLNVLQVELSHSYSSSRTIAWLTARRADLNSREKLGVLELVSHRFSCVPGKARKRASFVLGFSVRSSGAS